MKLSTQILLAFSVVILLSIIDSYTNYLLSIRVKQNTEFLNRSESVIRNSARLHSAMIEMQSGFRGFLLTADTNFLDRYDQGLSTVPRLFAEQRSLMSETPSQVALLDSIRHLHFLWIDYSDSLVHARKGLALSAESVALYDRLFETRLKKMIGKKINDEISEKLARFDRNEYLVRSARSERLIQSVERTHTFSFIFLSLTVLIGIASAVYIVRLISRRISMMVNFAETISRGEFTQVKDTRKDELARLSSALNTMSDRLSNTIRELENRNAELDKFAYVVSHDLKAPVRGIQNVIHWIEEDMGESLSPELRKYLSIIPQRAKRMEDLINGLLDYAKTREKTPPETVDVNRLVTDIIESIVPRYFQVEVDELPVITTERLKLEQVFSNLVSNAVKYTGQDNALLFITCREIPGYYEFSVRDNGIGIDPEYHRKIFEIFQTLREKNEKESTGIGLAIIQKILEDQHCSIRVESTVGSGSAFIFTWPRLNK